MCLQEHVCFGAGGRDIETNYTRLVFGVGDGCRKVIRSKLANRSFATGYGAKLVCFAGSLSVNVNSIRKAPLLKIVRSILNFGQ